MLQYACDTCGGVREGLDKSWILGFAAESIGITAARREVTFLPHWDEDQAVRWLAVHFCCDDCRDAYMSVLFEEPPIAPEIEQTVVAVTPAKSTRKVTRIETAASPTKAVTRTTLKRSVRKPASSRKTKKRRAS